jgi:hypothetical protein
MKLRIGHKHETFGTVEDTPDGLRYAGDTATLRKLVHDITAPEKPENAPGGLAGFMPWLARQTNNGYLWSESADDTQEDK